MRCSVSRLAACLLAASLLSGCTSFVDRPRDGPDPSPPDPGDEVEDCEHYTLDGTTDGQRWEAAWIECHATVPGKTRQSLACTRPGEATLTVSADLEAGRVTVRVRDADDQVVAEERVRDTGGRGQNVTMDVAGHPAGTWTVTGVRGDAFEGTYRLELWCPSE